MNPSMRDEQSGISEALRSAIENTFAATVDSAGETRERAAGLLDEAVRQGRAALDQVARRGQDAREGVVKRGQEARHEVVRKGQEASAEVVARVEQELQSISERLAKLEASLRKDRS